MCTAETESKDHHRKRLSTEEIKPEALLEEMFYNPKQLIDKLKSNDDKLKRKEMRRQIELRVIQRRSQKQLREKENIQKTQLRDMMEENVRAAPISEKSYEKEFEDCLRRESERKSAEFAKPVIKDDLIVTDLEGDDLSNCTNFGKYEIQGSAGHMTADMTEDMTGDVTGDTTEYMIGDKSGESTKERRSTNDAVVEAILKDEDRRVGKTEEWVWFKGSPTDIRRIACVLIVDYEDFLIDDVGESNETCDDNNARGQGRKSVKTHKECNTEQNRVLDEPHEDYISDRNCEPDDNFEYEDDFEPDQMSDKDSNYSDDFESTAESDNEQDVTDTTLAEQISRTETTENIDVDGPSMCDTATRRVVKPTEQTAQMVSVMTQQTSPEVICSTSRRSRIESNKHTKKARNNSPEQKFRAITFGEILMILLKPHPSFEVISKKYNFSRCRPTLFITELREAIFNRRLKPLQQALCRVEEFGYHVIRLKPQYERGKALLDFLQQIEKLTQLMLDKRTMAEIRNYPLAPKMVHQVIRTALLLMGESESETEVTCK